MHNHVRYCRSNYVIPMCERMFTDHVSSFNDLQIEEAGKFMAFTGVYSMPEKVAGKSTGIGASPGWLFEEIVRFAKGFADLLHHGDVLVVREIGFCGSSYLIGNVVAIHSSGRTCMLSLDDIVAKAGNAFGVDCSSINQSQLLREIGEFV